MMRVVPKGGPFNFVWPSGYLVFAVRALDPRLERERSRDGSCVNLSAQERNAKRLEDASQVFIDHANRSIHCPTHVVEALSRSIPKG